MTLRGVFYDYTAYIQLNGTRPMAVCQEDISYSARAEWVGVVVFDLQSRNIRQAFPCPSGIDGGFLHRFSGLCLHN